MMKYKVVAYPEEEKNLLRQEATVFATNKSEALEEGRNMFPNYNMVGVYEATYFDTISSAASC